MSRTIGTTDLADLAARLDPELATIDLLNEGLELEVALASDPENIWWDLAVEPGSWFWFQWEMRGSGEQLEMDLTSDPERAAAVAIMESFGSEPLFVERFGIRNQRLRLMTGRRFIWPEVAALEDGIRWSGTRSEVAPKMFLP